MVSISKDKGASYIDENGKSYEGECYLSLAPKREFFKKWRVLRNEVSFEEGTENYDFNQEIKATDLSNIDLQYDLSSLDINKAGDYQIKVFAKDSSGNQAEKEITVHVKEKPKQELSAAKIYHGGGKVICIDAGHQARGNSSLEPNGPGSSTMKAKVTTGATGCVTGKTESQSRS